MKNRQSDAITHLFSPAKINLGLQVVHRRSKDSYHYLYSIFVPISFGDELRIHLTKEDGFSSLNELPEANRSQFEAVSERGNPADNLIAKALQLTRAYRKFPLHVHLIKRIPLGSGLGGGSSNAGVLLRWIANHCLSKTANLASENIIALALTLGSDVRFFLQSEAALVSGVGDKQRPIAVGSGLGVLALPPIYISTAKAYRSLKMPLQPTLPSKTWSWLREDVRQSLGASQWNKLCSLENDFESVIFPSHTELKRLKEAFFKEGADFALMSGSGSSVYALVDSKGKQEVIAKNMKSKFPCCHFINFHFGRGASV